MRQERGHSLKGWYFPRPHTLCPVHLLPRLPAWGDLTWPDLVPWPECCGGPTSWSPIRQAVALMGTIIR